MTLKIVAGAIAALALAGTAHAQSGAPDSSSTQAQTMAPPAQDCSLYATPPAQCTQSDPGAPVQTYTYDGQSQSAAQDDTDRSERWRRPERRGWRRLLLPVDLVREGASAVRHKF